MDNEIGLILLRLRQSQIDEAPLSRPQRCVTIAPEPISECLDRMIFFGRQSLERAVTEYVEHYHAERNHQGLGNELIEPDEEVGSVAGKIECRERLGGMLKYYHRRAA